MSRIDEALKRAAGNLGDAKEFKPHHPADPTLERYPSEGGRIVEADTRHEPVGTRTVEPRRVQVLRPITHTPRQVDATRLKTDPRLVTSNIDFIGVEQYRRLAASLHDAQIANGLRVVTVTSALPKDGKTLTAVNLALTLSESYSRRVLLIDADLRRPAVHTVLGIQNRGGLNEVLRDGLRELPVVSVTPTLSVLTAGQSDSTLLAGLASDQMRSLLDDCVARFDWVFIDVPPVGLLADAQILGHLTGAVILVIRAGITPYAVVERAVAQIGREAIIGTVLNAMEDRSVYEDAHYGDYQRDHLSLTETRT